MLYASSTRFGALLETLARFRPDIATFAGLLEIEGDRDALSAGTVPREWFGRRVMGVAELAGSYADIGAAALLATVRSQLAARALYHGLPDVDAAAIRVAAPRRTQVVSIPVLARHDAHRDLRSRLQGHHDQVAPTNARLQPPKLAHPQTDLPVARFGLSLANQLRHLVAAADISQVRKTLSTPAHTGEPLFDSMFFEDAVHSATDHPRARGVLIGGGLLQEPAAERCHAQGVVLEAGRKMVSEPVVRINDPLPKRRARRLWQAKRAQHVLTSRRSLKKDRQKLIRMANGKSRTHIPLREHLRDNVLATSRPIDEAIDPGR